MKFPKNIFIGLSVILTLTAFVLSFYIFQAGRPNAQTFSSIGEANRAWFLIYSFTLALAFSLNLVIFTKTKSIKNRRILFLIYVLLGFAVIFSLLQSIIIGPVFHGMHVIFAGIFTGFGSLALITAIIAKLKFTKCKNGYYYFAMLLLTGLMNFYAVYAYGWLTATYQWMFATTLLATSCSLALIP